MSERQNTCTAPGRGRSPYPAVVAATDAITTPTQQPMHPYWPWNNRSTSFSPWGLTLSDADWCLEHRDDYARVHRYRHLTAVPASIKLLAFRFAC